MVLHVTVVLPLRFYYQTGLRLMAPGLQSARAVP